MENPPAPLIYYPPAPVANGIGLAARGPAFRAGRDQGARIVSYLVAYVAALLVFLIVDAVWLNAVMAPIFERNLGDMLLETPRLGIAAGFYAFYLLGVLYFAVGPAAGAGSWRVAAGNGAVLGFLAYGTYEATNLATLRGWTLGMLAMDVVWGAALTAVSAVAGYLAWRWFAG